MAYDYEATRCVALIDMDCFYCACERALLPELVGVALAVVQYNPFQGDGSAGATGVVSIPAQPATARIAIKNGKILMPSAMHGSIIAVSYEARARGVTRFFRAREALTAWCVRGIRTHPASRSRCGKSRGASFRTRPARTLSAGILSVQPGDRDYPGADRPRQERHELLPRLWREDAQDNLQSLRWRRAAREGFGR